MNQINKKGGVSISVVLIVLFSLIISLISLFYFMTKNNSADASIDETEILEKVYSRQSVLDYYIQNIVDKSAKESVSREKFVDNFKSEIENYKDGNGFFAPELEQALNQIDGSEIVVGDKVSVKMNFVIEDEIDGLKELLKTK